MIEAAARIRKRAGIFSWSVRIQLFEDGKPTTGIGEAVATGAIARQTAFKWAHALGAERLHWSDDLLLPGESCAN